MRDVRIYDTIEDADGKERRVLNAKETTLAAQKQQAIREAFRDWIWRDPERRQTLVRQYNEEMNSTRPREYDGSHITFGGMNPAITLREHQKSAIASGRVSMMCLQAYGSTRFAAPTPTAVAPASISSRTSCALVTPPMPTMGMCTASYT